MLSGQDPRDLNNSYEAMQRAYSALSVIEQLEACVEGFKGIQSRLEKELAEEADIHINKLESLVNLIDDRPEDSGVPELFKGVKLSNSGNMTKIERLGLASQVVRLKEIKRYSVNEIAEILQIDANSIRRFLKYYDQAPLSTKTKYQRASIFDTTAQYEEVGTMIYRQLARIEHDPENHVKYISELRQLLKAAHEWMDRVQTQNQMTEVKEAIVEVLLSCLPDQREKIIRKFASIGIKGFKSISAIESF